MDDRLLKILVCPICKSKLFYNNKTQELVCMIDKLSFPIKDDIPILIASKARNIK